MAEVSQLEARAYGIALPDCIGVGGFGQSQKDTTNGVRTAGAVGQYVIIVVVANDMLILAECVEQFLERFQGQGVSQESGAQGDKNRMVAVSGKALFQFVPPPVQQIDRAGCFIREIVGPAAVSVNIVKILANRFWQQETGDGKILVVIQGKVFAVSFGFGH